MNRFLLGAIALAAIAAGGSASAADLAVKAPVYKAPPAPPPFSWTGFYIGANGGGAWGTTDWTYVVEGSDASHKSSGGLAGGTAGYNWQFAPNWVIGVEGDFDWADINGSTACPNPAFSCQSKISDLATLRGRFGYAVNRFLVYGTGGVAWGNDQIQTTLPGGFVPPSGGPTNGTTGWRTGWTAGVGGEWAFWGPWSAKVEYLHYDLGSATTTVDSPELVRTQERGNLVRAGVNWKFGP